MLRDVVGSKRTQRLDRAAPMTKVGEQACHQTISHASASKAWVGFDVWHHNHLVVEAILGNRHDVLVDDQLVALALGVVSNGVLHVRSVPPKHAPGASMIP